MAARAPALRAETSRHHSSTTWRAQNRVVPRSPVKSFQASKHFSGTAVSTGPPAMNRLGEFAAQAVSGRFLLGEFVDDDERDIFGDGARDGDGSFGKAGGVELARHGAGTERLADRDCPAGQEIDDMHAVRPAGFVLEVSLHDAADAFAVAQPGAGEIGEQRVDVVFRPIEDRRQMIGIDVVKV